MRLWHQYLIKYLPNKQLLGQHREICGLRGLGFGRKHKTVDYVFKYPYYFLYEFHILVIKEMKKRGYKVNHQWYNSCYRGKKIKIDSSKFTSKCFINNIIYKEHNNKYLLECLINLKNKGITLKIDYNSKLYTILEKNCLLDYVDIN